MGAGRRRTDYCLAIRASAGDAGVEPVGTGRGGATETGRRYRPVGHPGYALAAPVVSMVRYTGAWDRDGVDAFLTDAVVPVRLACHTPTGPLWMLSLWFRWDATEGAIWCATGRDADVVDYLTADDEVAFEVSTNEPPYRGVRGNGVASIDEDEDKQLLRWLLNRYLGGTDSSLARRLLDPDREEVRIRIDPRRVHSWDYSGRMKDAEDDENAGGDSGDADDPTDDAGGAE